MYLKDRLASSRDQLLAALLRTTAGGGDHDAVALLHRPRRGVSAMSARDTGRGPGPLPAIVVELSLRIRSFPWRRRRHAVAATLLLDVRTGVPRALRPYDAGYPITTGIAAGTGNGS